MPQAKLSITAPRADARRIYALFEVEFEDDGYPVGITEIDEARGIELVELYVEGDGAEEKRRADQVLAASGIDGSVEAEILPEIDWVTKSLEGLKPVRAGRFLVHGSHDRNRIRANDLAIEIEAGLAFGTGHHGTTAGCLETIERVTRQEHPRNALDLGAGSAVLAIGLAKLARIPVLATDIDAVAVEVARENIRANGVASLVDAVTATGFSHRAIAARAPYDLIVANILARPLMNLAPDMARHLAPGGSLILSGILTRQRRAVIAAYAGQQFRHVHTLVKGEWVTIHLKRG
ncbi:50S ribosomal protein L11 methyltransferase [Aquibium oceanicum]|uniref:Ribosomal protein L11 methyltransferase n=1 Tax=Aquibium oceanicum TaxID=1670800 RepID=A0A1L3STL0_9HYPH|nr:50S ribosomal protein L11 methyltransferase [Aquibium oceanicum]APH72757.1 ribosomal protein L11 methyltransferase [Aquibium oceanicum]